MQNNFFPNVIENIFYKILLPKTTAITVPIMYKPPTQTNFLENLNMTLEKVHIDKKYLRNREIEKYLFLAIST